MHGRTSPVIHCGTDLFAGVLSPLTVCRYHSLVIEESSLPAELVVTARTGDGAIMAIEHADHPVCGVQFHPEATLTQHGFRLLANFLRLAGIDVTDSVDDVEESEFSHAALDEPPLPNQPVTF